MAGSIIVNTKVPPMTMQHPIIEQYRDALMQYLQMQGKFNKQIDRAERISIVRSLLESKAPGIENASLAFDMLKSMNTEEKKDFVGEIAPYLRVNSPYDQFAREFILSLPRDWLIANIELYVSPILDGGDQDEYYGVLELYRQIHQKLMIKVAQLALTSDDWTIREAGEYYLERYG